MGKFPIYAENSLFRGDIASAFDYLVFFKGVGNTCFEVDFMNDDDNIV